MVIINNATYMPDYIYGFLLSGNCMVSDLVQLSTRGNQPQWVPCNIFSGQTDAGVTGRGVRWSNLTGTGHNNW